MGLSDNQKALEAQIKESALQCNRNPQEISYIVVSKGRSLSEIKEAYALGIRDFGENRVDEALNKKDKLPSDIRWHFIGRLQKNKVAKVVGEFTLIHSVDSFELAEKISSISLKKDLLTPILLQANTSKEASKAGLSSNEWKQLFPRLCELKGIEIVGLMTMAPLTHNEALIHNCFKELKSLQSHLDDKRVKILSMGMSQDFPIAIQEGATLLRLGTVFFMGKNG